MPPTAAQWIVMVLLGLGPIGSAFMLWDIGMKHGNVAFLGVLGYATTVISTTLLIALGLAGADLGAAGVGHADRAGGAAGGAAAAQGLRREAQGLLREARLAGGRRGARSAKGFTAGFTEGLTAGATTGWATGTAGAYSPRRSSTDVKPCVSPIVVFRRRRESGSRQARTTPRPSGRARRTWSADRNRSARCGRPPDRTAPNREKSSSKLAGRKLDHTADVCRDLPVVGSLGEVLDQQLDRQPALHPRTGCSCRPAPSGATSVDRSVARISIRKPSSAAPISRIAIASEYGFLPG